MLHANVRANPIGRRLVAREAGYRSPPNHTGFRQIWPQNRGDQTGGLIESCCAQLKFSIALQTSVPSVILHSVILQAYTSVAKASLKLVDNRKLAYAMNTAVFHLKMVDYLDEVLQDTSDLSIYWYVAHWLL